jgi:molybdopterin molybdotransferase
MEAVMLSPAEAVESILSEIRPLGAEPVALADALGRVLAERVVSPVTLPHWDNSAMDGYAVRAADVRGATRQNPARLGVIETIAAGGFASRAVEAGQAARIMTGAPLPSGADSVVRVEDTDGGTTSVQVFDDRDAERNIRPRGEDLHAGDEVLAAGQVLAAPQIGVLASVGAASVQAHRRPRVAIAGSGDELVDLDHFDEVLAGRRIVSSNSYTLDALVRSCGAIPVNLGVARDSMSDVRRILERARDADLILTSAGVSVGEHDYTRAALVEMGAKMKFWRVRMRPGAPIGFGFLGRTPWIGLPGNPVSAMVTFELFARPALRRMQGLARVFKRPLPVEMEEPVTLGPRLTHFLRAVVQPGADGVWRGRLTGPQGSGILTSMARANALLVVPEDKQRVEAGDRLHCLLLGEDGMFVDRFSLGSTASG